jgi:hypothetical protein
MYKPNGEERMSDQEARQRREAMIERRIERERAASTIADALGTSIYATLLRSDPREELIEAGFSNLR